jgi:hypothetical protein
MDLGIRVRVRSRFTLNRKRDEWIRQTWEAFTPGDVAQRPPLDQRSGGAEEDQLAGMNPGGAMLFLLCFSNVGEGKGWWHRTTLLPSSPSLDQGGSRSTFTNYSPSFFSFCGPPMKDDARPRTQDARGTRSPTARKYGGGGAAVESGRWYGRRRERKRETRGKKWIWEITAWW